MQAKVIDVREKEKEVVDRLKQRYKNEDESNDLYESVFILRPLDQIFLEPKFILLFVRETKSTN